MCSWFFSGGSSGSKQGREHVSQRELSGLWKLNENEWNYSVSICFDDVGVFWILCLDFAISICFGVPAKLASLKDERVSRTTRFQQTWQFPNVSNILRGFAGSCGWRLWASVLQNPADMSEIVRLKAVGQPAGSWKETGFLMFVVCFFSGIKFPLSWFFCWTSLVSTCFCKIHQDTVVVLMIVMIHDGIDSVQFPGSTL